MMSFMTECSTTSSKMFSTRMKREKSSKISSWKRGSSWCSEQQQSELIIIIIIIISVQQLPTLSQCDPSHSGIQTFFHERCWKEVFSTHELRQMLLLIFQVFWRQNAHRGTGRTELLQHVGDEDLEESLAEETLPHCAAVIVKFLRKKKEKETDMTS